MGSCKVTYIVIRRLRREECVIRRVSREIRAYFNGIAFIRQIENSFVLDHRREITFYGYILHLLLRNGDDGS